MRIGIIGLDTTHAAFFLERFNVVGAIAGGSPEISRSAGRIAEFTRVAVERHGVRLYTSPARLAKASDALMILGCDGRKHLEQFQEVAGKGKPVFIDKPFAASIEDIGKIIRLARATRTPCFSASSLRYALEPDRELCPAAAFVQGPAELEPHHPDLFWYGIHGVELLYTLLGAGCRSVVRTHAEKVDVVTGVWQDGRVGTFQGLRTGRYEYEVTLSSARGTRSQTAFPNPEVLAENIRRFFETGIEPVALETTFEIYAFMAAADESKRANGRSMPLHSLSSL